MRLVHSKVGQFIILAPQQRKAAGVALTLGGLGLDDGHRRRSRLDGYARHISTALLSVRPVFNGYREVCRFKLL